MIIRKYFKQLVYIFTYAISFHVFAVSNVNTNDMQEDFFKHHKQFIQGKIDHLIKEPSSLVLQESSEAEKMLLTNFGFKIENYCFTKLGKEKLYTTVKQTVAKGLQCLLNLSNDNLHGKMYDSLDKALQMIDLFSSENKISLICSEEEGEGSSDEKNSYISIDPNDNYIKRIESNNLLVQGLFFTSIISNLNNDNIEDSYYTNTDNDTIDYSYACSECCFSRNINKRQKLACKICQGDYVNANDHQYFKDLIAYKQTLGGVDDSHIYDIGLKAIKRFRKRSPWGTAFLLEYEASPSSHGGR